MSALPQSLAILSSRFADSKRLRSYSREVGFLPPASPARTRVASVMKGSQPQKAGRRGVVRRGESSREPLLVLHINDSTDDQVLFQAAAQQAGVPIELHVAESAHQAISYFASLLNLEREHPVRWVDLVVLDIVLRDISGLMVVQYIRSTPAISTVPVVVFTGNMNPATIAQAYRLGVNAVHAKPTNFQDTVKLAGALYADWSRGSRAERKEKHRTLNIEH